MPRLKDHSYEELLDAVVQILAGKATGPYEPSQYGSLRTDTAHVLARREGVDDRLGVELSYSDSDTFLEVFWDLFRQGVITLGRDDANREFPFFRVSRHGKSILASGNTYYLAASGIRVD